MTQQKHPFDVVAERLEAAADRPVAGQEPSPHYWEFRLAADESVGDYPQAVYAEPPDWGDSDGLGPDGFPAVPIAGQVLQPQAKWTDVLSSNLWSDGYLLNPKALAAFRQCDLGNSREYPVTVRDQSGRSHALVYLYVRNIVPLEGIDFRRSEFYVADMVGQFREPIAIDSPEDRESKGRLVRDGQWNGCEKFSRIVYKSLYFKPGHRPTADLFKLARLGITVYASSKLRDLVVGGGVTGLEFKPNRRLVVE